MIAYTEKGPGLHAAIAAAGHWLIEQDGVWVSSDDVSVQSIIDSFDPLPEAKAAKWEQIKAERDRRKHAGFAVGANRFHSDPDSRIQQLGLVIMGASVPAVAWKTMGGSFVTMTQALALAIFQATAQADAALFAAAEAKRAAVNALTSLSEIEAFDPLSNWPEV
jgi:hypothetical protein